MLSFKEEQIIDTKPIHKEEPKIDIIKLMRYTKRGNKKWFKEELKKKSVKRLNEFPIRPKSHTTTRNNLEKNTIHEIEQNNHTNESKPINQNIPNNIGQDTNKENEKIESNNTNNNVVDISNLNKNKANAFSNFKNTIKTVRNEAVKAYFLDENFDRKKDTMDGLFNNKILPKIEDYENLNKKNAKNKEKEKVRKKIDIEKANEEEYGENKNKKNKSMKLILLVKKN